jgi:hypothetical protein
MRRDLDLIRKILRTVEASDDFTLKCGDFSEDPSDVEETKRIARHVFLLVEAGLLEANLLVRREGGGAEGGTIDRLTWAGHEFIAAAGNDTTWSKAKRTIGAQIGGVPFELLKMWLIWEAKQKLGLPSA